MPPRKRQPAAPPAAKRPNARRSKLAKDNDITAEEEADIRAAWALFRVDADVDGYEEEREGVIETANVQKALVAQGLGPKSTAELDEFVDILDPERDGYVTYGHFVELSALQLKHRAASTAAADDEAEVDEAFALFTQQASTPGATITLQHLRSVARLLKEDVGDDVLKAMILEANDGQGLTAGVDRQHFKQVMMRAGVFK